jgi:hypothetical protein
MSCLESTGCYKLISWKEIDRDVYVRQNHEKDQ